MRTWGPLLFRGLLYGGAILLMWPVLLLLRIDPRIDYAQDIVFGMEGET